jgi:hypothetical protein
MFTDDTLDDLKDAIRTCDEAREALVDALDAADAQGRSAASDPDVLKPVGAAIDDWQSAQKRFMTLVESSGAPNPATAALLLKKNHGVDASNARCGIPGTDVDGADQPFPLDLTGGQGMVFTQAATEHLG